MTALWYPPAHKLPQPHNGAFTGGPPKGLLHSTESQFGKGWASYLPGTHPHFEATARLVTKTVEFRQFYPLDQPSRALADGPLAIRTNRDGVIQIECGFQAAHVDNVPDWFWSGLAPLLRWVEDNAGVNPLQWAIFKAYPDSYGTSNGVRFTPHAWDTYGGWLGHMHVPDGNSHGDPGAIPVGKLRWVPKVAVKPQPVPPAPDPIPPILWPHGPRHPAWTKVLQRHLHIPASGAYDASTRRLVVAYRRHHGLHPYRPAVVGPRMWRRLLKGAG